MQNAKNLFPVALMHAIAHITAVISLGAGAVSFTHIVKAAEPAFTAMFSALFLKQFFAPVVYLSLVPVMGGVAIASLTERKFSWLAFNSAMLANTASAGRGIFAKKTMKEPQGQNMDAANLYAVLTVMATLIMAPVTLLVEGNKAKAAWDAALAVCSQEQLLTYIISSGLYFYLYNEVRPMMSPFCVCCADPPVPPPHPTQPAPNSKIQVAFLALDSVHPVTHAVGNTIKRVVIIAASILVFKNPVTTQGYIGSAVAIAGVLLYSLAVRPSPRGWESVFACLLSLPSGPAPASPNISQTKPYPHRWRRPRRSKTLSLGPGRRVRVLYVIYVVCVCVCVIVEGA